MNSNNLVPNNERSPEKLREMGRKGGIASGKARRKKAEIKKLANMLIERKTLKELAEFFADTGKQGQSPGEQ